MSTTVIPALAQEWKPDFRKFPFSEVVWWRAIEGKAGSASDWRRYTCYETIRFTVNAASTKSAWEYKAEECTGAGGSVSSAGFAISKQVADAIRAGKRVIISGPYITTQ